MNLPLLPCVKSQEVTLPFQDYFCSKSFLIIHIYNQEFHLGLGTRQTDQQWGRFCLPGLTIKRTGFLLKKSDSKLKGLPSSETAETINETLCSILDRNLNWSLIMKLVYFQGDVIRLRHQSLWDKH